MKKVTLALFVLIISARIHGMSLLTAIDPSQDEKQRGVVGSFLRKLLKNSGMYDKDLIGLGTQVERARSEKIWTDLKANPGDTHLQGQFCERQGVATSMALSLIAQLEEFCENEKLCANNDASSSSSSSPLASIIQESYHASELVERSIALRKLHATKSLPPETTIRLIDTTNQARKRIKELLKLTDSTDSSETDKAALLTEEPVIDEKMIEAVPRRIVIAHALKLLQEGLIAGDEKIIEAFPSKTVLAHASKLLNNAPEELLPHKTLIARTVKLLADNAVPADDEELQLIHRLALLTFDRVPREKILMQASILMDQGHILPLPDDEEEKTPPPPRGDED